MTMVMINAEQRFLKYDDPMQTMYRWITRPTTQTKRMLKHFYSTNVCPTTCKRRTTATNIAANADTRKNCTGKQSCTPNWMNNQNNHGIWNTGEPTWSSPRKSRGKTISTMQNIENAITSISKPF